MTPLDFLRAKRAHAARLANQSGASGERLAVAEMEHWIARPSGTGLKTLLKLLLDNGSAVKGSSFDVIHVPGLSTLDFTNESDLRSAFPSMTFIEIKTATQSRVKPGFGGFFFALTESEITAAEILGARHRVALFNRLTGEVLLTSVSEILAKAKSSNWQLSVQL